ncbi:ParB N-terminal domain-containing protein [Pseudonocardia alni]|uniref:ParB N-terminal domain-containing protein n=1 Tax=Pseudonocardia alni TaxID=33907 RepID=UPI00247A9EA9|nr:ParB N-terminal domain-containing protein [Pseudonocardia alni]WFG47295.1 ParB N-terminal domain-containing protein [Pseudonocardia alni]
MTVEPTPATETAVLDAAAFGRLALVDPNTLELEVNTRLDANLDPHFCASIRDRGVREPITVRRRASDGTLIVRTGQRRTLAAVRVGLSQVPVIISPEPASEDGDDVDPTARTTGTGRPNESSNNWSRISIGVESPTPRKSQRTSSCSAWGSSRPTSRKWCAPRPTGSARPPRPRRARGRSRSGRATSWTWCRCR